MKQKNLTTFIGVGTLALVTSVNVWSQRPAEPPAGPHARVVLAPSGSTPSDPEQEAAEEMNRILRSLRTVQRFFGIDERVLWPIVEGTYDEALALLRQKHELAKELRDLMKEPNPPPGQVGQLIMDIRELNAEIKAISHSWGDEIEEVLDVDQLEKLEMVRRIAGLIPAFKQVGLIPPPPPRLRPEAE